jgi:hypothetical protein
VKRLLAAACLAAASCSESPEPPAPSPSTPKAAEGFQIEPDIDVDNLLSIARGAVVISRTGELNLNESALHAADGLPSSTWSLPPGGPNQTAVFALAAPAHVQSLGVSVTKSEEAVPQRVRISLSSDGRQWNEALVMEPKAQESPQVVSVTPAEAQYIRVQTEEPAEYHSHIRSIHVIGDEKGAFRIVDAAGCWTMNGAPAQLAATGARVTGSIGGGTPTQLLGGTDQRVVRLMWLQPPLWGYALASTSPDGRVLNALVFHEEPFTGYIGNAWFGSRCNSASQLPEADPEMFLQRAGRWSLFGLAFDTNDAIVEEPSRAELDQLATLLRSDPSRYRLVSREFRLDTPEANKTRSAARLESLRRSLARRGVDINRVESSASGNDWNREPISTTTQYVLMSRIDLERK